MKRKKIDPIDCCIVSIEVLVTEVKLNTGKHGQNCHSTPAEWFTVCAVVFARKT